MSYIFLWYGTEKGKESKTSLRLRVASLVAGATSTRETMLTHTAHTHADKGHVCSMAVPTVWMGGICIVSKLSGGRHLY